MQILVVKSIDVENGKIRFDYTRKDLVINVRIKKGKCLVCHKPCTGTARSSLCRACMEYRSNRRRYNYSVI